MNNTTTTENALRTPIRPFALRFSMIQPLPNRALMLRNYVAPNGVITVSLRRTDPAAVRYYCRVGLPADPLPLASPIDFTLPPPANHFQLQRVGPPDFFQAQNIPVTGIPVDAPAVNNQKINVGAYAADGTLLEPEPTSFIAVPQQRAVSIPAQGCLFFAYAPLGAAVPRPPAGAVPGDILEQNRPYIAAVPIDAAHVLIAVPLDGAGQRQQWHNSGGEHSAPKKVFADGEDNDSDDTIVDYMSLALLSHHISPLLKAHELISTWEGLLAGMWDFGVDSGTGIPNPTAVMSLGTGLREAGTSLLLDIPRAPGATAFNLLLGSHQESNWGRASDSLNVSLSWS